MDFQIESNIVKCPNPEYAEKMMAAIDAVRVRGDSVGGVTTCIVRNVPRVLNPPFSYYSGNSLGETKFNLEKSYLGFCMCIRGLVLRCLINLKQSWPKL